MDSEEEKKAKRTPKKPNTLAEGMRKKIGNKADFFFTTGKTKKDGLEKLRRNEARDAAKVKQFALSKIFAEDPKVQQTIKAGLEIFNNVGKWLRVDATGYEFVDIDKAALDEIMKDKNNPHMTTVMGQIKNSYPADWNKISIKEVKSGFRTNISNASLHLDFFGELCEAYGVEMRKDLLEKFKAYIPPRKTDSPPPTSPGRA